MCIQIISSPKEMCQVLKTDRSTVLYFKILMPYIVKDEIWLQNRVWDEGILAMYETLI